MARLFEQALIVDDSRTARAVLKHMLGKEAIGVEAVESAEQALDYLGSNLTDVIFMDHMMPGMDGFTAVKSLKSNERTAHIPIVMYTSKEGEVYKGQAQALGAAAILSKPATQEQLHVTLRELAELAVKAKEPVEALSDVELVEVIESDAAHERADQTVADSAPVTQEPKAIDATAQTEIDAVQNASASSSNFWIWVAGIAALLVAVLGARNAIISDALEQAENDKSTLLESLMQSSNVAGEYHSGEVPFAGGRIDTLEELLRGAQVAGFQGVIVARGHVGLFCQQQAASGELFVASDGLAIGDCDVIGQNTEAALRRSAQQSAAFKTFVANNSILAKGDIELRIEGAGSEQPVSDYPAVEEVKTAGDWNSIARKNNRVEFDLLNFE